MIETIRFQYGGHATFPVRYGWLSKGVHRLLNEGRFTPNLDTADDLGLGSKMVESLSFWMSASGLATSERGGLAPTALAELIYRRDRYFERPGTWWFVHLMLTRREGTVWSWFFNDYGMRIFDRIGCTDAFMQHAARHAQRPPSPATAQRELACLLSAYASRPGVDIVDPDDIGASPLRELGLITKHDAVNRYERARRPSGLPQEVFLASAAHLSETIGEEALTVRQLATLRGGPGKALCMGLETIETMVGKIGTKHYTRGYRSEVLNGERRLLLPKHSPEFWLEQLYDRVGAEGEQ